MKMSRKYFGTDGIRGRANTQPMTADVAMRLGLAAGAVMFNDVSALTYDQGSPVVAAAAPAVCLMHAVCSVRRRWHSSMRSPKGYRA